MKHLYSIVFSLCIVLGLSFIIVTPVFADPSFTTDPKNPLAFQKTTFVSGGCPASAKVRFGWKRWGENFAHKIPEPHPLADAGGKVTYDFATGFEAGDYTVWIECGGKTYEKFNVFTVTAIDPKSIEINEETVSADLKNLLISGCPPNGEILVEWAVEGFLPGGKESLTADDQGKAKKGFGPGKYTIDVACGGAVSQDNLLTVEGEDGKWGDAVFPTQPAAPSPVCDSMVNGACITVNTAIGKINTNGIGITYSIFVVLLSVSGGIMVLIIIYAGYQLMSSRGNPEQIQKARELITSAIIGFMFIIFSYVILGIITTDILHLPGFFK